MVLVFVSCVDNEGKYKLQITNLIHRRLVLVSYIGSIEYHSVVASEAFTIDQEQFSWMTPCLQTISNDYGNSSQMGTIPPYLSNYPTSKLKCSTLISPTYLCAQMYIYPGPTSHHTYYMDVPTYSIPGKSFSHYLLHGCTRPILPTTRDQLPIYPGLTKIDTYNMDVPIHYLRPTKVFHPRLTYLDRYILHGTW